MEELPTVLIGDAGGQHIEIRPLWRSHPKMRDYWDGNWIESEIEVHVGRFRGCYRGSLRSEEFAHFRNQLGGLAELLRGVASFTTMEGQLEVNMTGDNLGHIRVDGHARDDAGVGNLLTFGFEIDQTYLAGILRSLDAVVGRFPVVGSLDA